MTISPLNDTAQTPHRVSDRFIENAGDVLQFLHDAQQANIPCALCVLTNVSGGSARAVGTLVAVRADGEMAGYISHGCVDSDLRLQAQQAIKDKKPCEIVYGVGSKFMDLRLPCGGTVIILIDPAPKSDLCTAAFERLRQRQNVSLSFDQTQGLIDVSSQQHTTGWSQQIFTAHYIPPLRLNVAGIGAPLAAVSRLASAMQLEHHIYSPDPDFAHLPEAGAPRTFTHLTAPQAKVTLPLDPWSAVLLLFHDHDWEPNLLKSALASQAFYIGALGSRTTQHQRLETLKKQGVDTMDLTRIKGPIGLIPAARDAFTLAISTLAEITDAYRKIPDTIYSKMTEF